MRMCGHTCFHAALRITLQICLLQQQVPSHPTPCAPVALDRSCASTPDERGPPPALLPTDARSVVAEERPPEEMRSSSTSPDACKQDRSERMAMSIIKNGHVSVTREAQVLHPVMPWCCRPHAAPS
jgi:hypothetical protein